MLSKYTAGEEIPQKVTAGEEVPQKVNQSSQLSWGNSSDAVTVMKICDIDGAQSSQCHADH